MGDEAVCQIATVAPSHDSQSFRVGNLFGDQVINTPHNVLNFDLVFSSDQIREKVVAVAGRAPVVGTEYSVAAR